MAPTTNLPVPFATVPPVSDAYTVYWPQDRWWRALTVLLKRMTCLPRRGPRPVKHVSDEGYLTSAISVQGIYGLAPSSAADLDTILAGPPSPPIPRRCSAPATPRQESHF